MSDKGGGHKGGGHDDAHAKELSLVDRVDGYFKRQEEVADDLATHSNVVSEAYLNAAKLHLSHAKKKGAYAPSKLKDRKVREAMAKSIKEYIIKHHEARGRGKVGDDLYAQQIMNFYMGTTEQELGSIIGSAKAGYTLEQHQNVFQKRVLDRLKEIGQQHAVSALGGEEYHTQNLEFLGLKGKEKTIKHEDALHHLLETLNTEAGQLKYKGVKESYKPAGGTHH